MSFNLKELRESCGLKQSDIVAELSKDGIKANKSDISRLENGIIETYLFLGHKVAEILTLKVERGETKKPTEAKFGRLQLKYEERLIYDYILTHGSIDYDTAKIITFEQDRRKVREMVCNLRKVYPIIDLHKGWGLAQTEAECNKQIGIYEKKKRVYSRQETPLIAKRYDIQRGL